MTSVDMVRWANVIHDQAGAGSQQGSDVRNVLLIGSAPHSVLHLRQHVGRGDVAPCGGAQGVRVRWILVGVHADRHEVISVRCTWVSAQVTDVLIDREHLLSYSAR
ncbi:hypothetical protein ACFVUW_11645 [Streptomyces xiamenensis]|uniref:hypothetical protein n=1 Tax=Streptomyces xiamenensis TaxID=408015 RepID=UPI0036EFBAAC